MVPTTGCTGIVLSRPPLTAPKRPNTQDDFDIRNTFTRRLSLKCWVTRLATRLLLIFILQIKGLGRSRSFCLLFVFKERPTALATVLPEEFFSVLEEFVSIDSREFVLFDSINTNMVPTVTMGVISKNERILFEYSLMKSKGKVNIFCL